MNDRVRRALRHARQGVAAPVFARDQCAEIIQALEDLAAEEALFDVANALARTNGGHWGEHPEHPVAAWVQEVVHGDTRLGYWAWVAGRPSHET